MNQALRVMNEIIDTGKATRPVLGVFFDRSFTPGKGAKISSLSPNEAAQKALDNGLKVVQNKCTKIEHKAIYE